MIAFLVLGLRLFFRIRLLAFGSGLWLCFLIGRARSGAWSQVPFVVLRKVLLFEVLGGSLRVCSLAQCSRLLGHLFLIFIPFASPVTSFSA
jgi:hypothetical protein